MKIRALAFGLAACAALAGCSGSHGPAGWQAVAGASEAWTNGAGASAQQYSYEKKPFSGTLQDLASQEAVNAVLRHRGAKFERSDTFGPCPGMAAIATFRIASARTLQEGFAVQSGQAVLVTYARPSGATLDPAVSRAMERALCVASL